MGRASLEHQVDVVAFDGDSGAFLFEAEAVCAQHGAEDGEVGGGGLDANEWASERSARQDGRCSERVAIEIDALSGELGVHCKGDCRCGEAHVRIRSEADRATCGATDNAIVVDVQEEIACGQTKDFGAAYLQREAKVGALDLDGVANLGEEELRCGQLVADDFDLGWRRCVGPADLNRGACQHLDLFGGSSK